MKKKTMKESKVIMINNSPFKVVEKCTTNSLMTKGRYDYADINDAYKTPSACKKYVWNVWYQALKEFSDKNNSFDIFIISRNSFQFTIGGHMFINNKPYNFYITRTRLELYPVIF